MQSENIYYMDLLMDSHGREIGNVRISLTDRCNLRCQYCMPESGIEWLEKTEILTFEEIMRLIRIFYSQGIKKFRLTGGEPLVRQNIVKLVRMIKSELNDIDLSMTTNGLGLSEHAADLKEAGLNRINISLDTLDNHTFEKLTRRSRLDDVLDGIKIAQEIGFDEIKINAVSIDSFNADLQTLQKFVQLSEKYKMEIRFIELMPFSGNNWKNGGYISSEKLREQINKIGKLIPLPMKDKNSTSNTWKLENRSAKFGFISSVSESFCSNCNRLRITAEGKLRPCLHSSREYDIRELLRNGGSNDDILDLIRLGLKEKWKEHPDFTKLSYLPPIDDREMIRIGG